MSFSVPADAYDRYMGRYSRLLAPRFADFAAVARGQQVLDVGCGPGALTAELAARVGANHVAAADPSAGFVRACAERVEGVDVRQAPAEELPWPTDSFDVVVSQLVLSFVHNAEESVSEMCRVVCAAGTVAACVWDYRGEMQMLRTFWGAALALDPATPYEGRGMSYADPESLRELWVRSGLREVATTPLVVEVQYADFDDFWEPFLTGTGPAGEYCASLDTKSQVALREECFRRLDVPSSAFTLRARAWAVRGLE